MIRIEEFENRSKTRLKTSFSNWLEMPATKMMVSMIPAGERQEVLITLLQSTFEQGFNTGQGEMARTFLEAMLKKDKKPEY